MANKQDQPSSSTEQRANKQTEEDPLLSIARMREQEQKEIAADMKKMQEMRTQHLKNINAIRSKRR